MFWHTAPRFRPDRSYALLHLIFEDSTHSFALGLVRKCILLRSMIAVLSFFSEAVHGGPGASAEEAAHSDPGGAKGRTTGVWVAVTIYCTCFLHVWIVFTVYLAFMPKMTGICQQTTPIPTICSSRHRQLCLHLFTSMHAHLVSISILVISALCLCQGNYM